MGLSYLYEETDPQKGDCMYRVLKTDGTYEHVTTIHYYDRVPEAIVSSPETLTKTVDEVLTLTLDVVDDGYSYQWYHNDKAIEGATEATYTIQAVKSAYAGSYYCKVSNPASYTNSTTTTVTVNKCAQVITFPELEAKTYGDADFTLPEVTDKGLKIVYQSSNPKVATVTGNNVHITGAGETTITANQIGSADYLEAAYVSRKLVVNKRRQTITFPEPAAKTYGDIPFTLPDVTDEGLPISYTSINTKVATVSGNTVTILNAGSTEIVASQAGDATRYEATPVTRTLVVNKAPQTITFEPFPTKTYGDAPIVLNAVTNRDLPITYTADSDVVSIEGNTITIVKPGKATVTAEQEGTDNFLAATSVSQPIVILKAPQTIHWDNIPVKTYGDEPVELPATTDKGLTITYTTSNENVAEIDGNKLIIKGAGNAEITASQEGDDYYLAASPVTLPVAVSKAYQTITFDEIPVKTYGMAPFKLEATTGSSSPIRYESSNSKVATIEGDEVTITGAGSCHITAYAAGDNNYYDASPVSQELTVQKGSQTVTFETVEDKTYGDAPFSLTASSSTGKTITFKSSNVKVVTVNGTVATIRGAGTAELTAVQEGDNNYLADNAKITVNVNKATLIARADDCERMYGDENPELTITYKGFVNGDGVSELSAEPVASTEANKLSNVGTYDITIGSVEDTNYSLMVQSGTLTIGKAPLTVKANDASRMYGDTNPEFSYTIDGFRNGDDERVLFSTPYTFTDAKSASKAGEYDIMVEGSDARNYELSYKPGILTVTKAPLEAHLADHSRMYGDENEFAISYSGFRNSDKKSVISSEPTVKTSADAKSGAGTYQATLEGGDAENYYFTYSYDKGASAKISVTKAPLKITADDKTIVVGSQLPIFTMTFDGFRNGDTRDNLDKFPYISAPEADINSVGEYPIVLSGGSDRNYEFELVNGTLKVDYDAGVSEIEADEEGDVEIYNLNGLLLYAGPRDEAKLERGFYIVRRGNTATKLYVK
ncbi:MAG: hypothetical protein K2I64_04330 [Muribaculaceae bacterium]|nr:hypothetical protein [Muribaculaceae bacterium]